MDTTLIHEICRALDIREQKKLVIRSQKYQDAAILRDIERQILDNISVIMESSGIISKVVPKSNNYWVIEKEIDNYLLYNYGVSYTHMTSISLRRELKLEEILKGGKS